MDNNDISAALNKLLSDPAALANAMSIAGSLMGNLPTDNAQTVTESPESKSTEQPQEKSEELAVNNPAQNNSPPPLESIAALAPLLSGGKKNDPRCALLYALKPYMGHGRGDKIDTLVNLLKIAEVAGGLLGGKLF